MFSFKISILLLTFLASFTSICAIPERSIVGPFFTFVEDSSTTLTMLIKKKYNYVDANDEFLSLQEVETVINRISEELSEYQIEKAEKILETPTLLRIALLMKSIHIWTQKKDTLQSISNHLLVKNEYEDAISAFKRLVTTDTRNMTHEDLEVLIKKYKKELKTVIEKLGKSRIHSNYISGLVMYRSLIENRIKEWTELKNMLPTTIVLQEIADKFVRARFEEGILSSIEKSNTVDQSLKSLLPKKKKSVVSKFLKNIRDLFKINKI